LGQQSSVRLSPDSDRTADNAGLVASSNDDGAVLNLLPTWSAIRETTAVDNPAQLYGFEPVAG